MHFDWEFDWDDGNTAKCAKHGLTQGEIESVFHLNPGVSPDPLHSQAEERFIATGKNRTGRFIFVVFCFRRGKIRPISARYMHRKEAQRYGIATHQSPGDDH